VSKQVASEVAQTLMPVVLDHLGSYEFLGWLNDQWPLKIEKSLWERNFRRTIDILEDTNLVNLKESTGDYSQLLIKHFLQATHKLCTTNTTGSAQLVNDSLAKILSQVWPMSADLSLIKYLMFHAQYIHLSAYCFETKWLTQTRNLRAFLSAHCNLFFDQIDAAIQLFLKASYNLEKDPMLKRLTKLSQFQQHQATNAKMQSDENMQLMSYYTKVIHYFDLNGNLEASIELIQNALLKCQFNVASKSKLYSVLFKSYMDLDYYDKAHLAMVSNFDVEWKRTCLKHFISELCNKSKHDLLVRFDYDDLFQDVIDILYKRAQSSDLRSHDYYRLLYALHLKNKDYRKAAFYMYESSARLKHEISGISSLRRQEKCLLLSLNLLKMCDQKLAWIAVNGGGGAGGHKEEDLTVIVDAVEINRQFVCVSSMIKLSSVVHSQSSLGSSSSSSSVDELVTLLLKNYMYDDAVLVSLALKASENAPLTCIINSLVDRCCHVVASTSDKINDTELFIDYEIIKNNESIRQPQSPYESPMSLKWKLLHSYLVKFNDSSYFKAACIRIITIGFQVPHYIVDSFKKRDTHSLLKIYVNYGLWEKAIELVQDYIDAILTNERLSSFDIKDSLLGSNSRTCAVSFPYTAVDELLNNALC
jgi:tetratricopeptide (TPR) repeat protein